MCRNMSAAVKLLSSGASNLQIEKSGIKAHENPVQLAQGRDLRRVFIEGPQRQVIGDLIHHVTAQILSKSLEIAAQMIFQAENGGLVPSFVHKSKNTMSQLR